jgi:hypothetical protein
MELTTGSPYLLRGISCAQTPAGSKNRHKMNMFFTKIDLDFLKIVKIVQNVAKKELQLAL